MKLGIVADIHEDVLRLQQAIELLKNQWCEKLVCLWDLVGYAVPYYWYLKSRNGSEVIKLVRGNCDIVIPGNHDLFHTQRIPEYSWWFTYPEDWFDLDYPTRKALADDKIWLIDYDSLYPLLSKKDEEYLRYLPEYVIKTYGDLNILFSHWVYPDLSGSTKWESDEVEAYHSHFDFMKKHSCSLSLAGHSHWRRYWFTEDWLRDIAFNETIQISDSLCGFVVPSVANGTEPNGVAILDTEQRTMTYLSLWTPVHVVPDWKKL